MFIGLVTALGAGLLLRRRRNGIFLIGLLVLPLLFSLAVATGGQSRVYVYLLPFICIACAVTADAVARWLHGKLSTRLPSPRLNADWLLHLAVLIAFVLLVAAFRNSTERPAETGYRDTGRWVQEQTHPGDVVIVPYIVDSGIGYYSAGTTVQRVGEAVRQGIQRLFIVTRPGVPRFDLDDLMLASNFTTDAAGHLDTHSNWQLPATHIAPVEHFDLNTVSQISGDLQQVDLGRLTQPENWQLFAETQLDATEWSHTKHDELALLHIQSNIALPLCCTLCNVSCPIRMGWRCLPIRRRAMATHPSSA